MSVQYNISAKGMVSFHGLASSLACPEGAIQSSLCGGSGSSLQRAGSSPQSLAEMQISSLAPRDSSSVDLGVQESAFALGIGGSFCTGDSQPLVQGSAGGSLVRISS